jgi:hypothetical protein
MAVGYVTTVRNSRLNVVRDACDAGTGAGKVRIYSGTRPATGGAETTILAELTLSDPCAPAATGGVLTFSAITGDTSANNSGTATWARLLDSANTAVADLGVTATGGGGELQLVSTSITAGEPVNITSMTITAGNA